MEGKTQQELAVELTGTDRFSAEDFFLAEQATN